MPRGLDDECGLASLSAMGDGREIGRVRFDEHPVKRNLPGGLADVLRLWKADVAGEGDHEAHFNRTLCVVQLSGEAVQHAAKAMRRPMLLDERKRVSPGIFRVLC